MRITVKEKLLIIFIAGLLAGVLFGNFFGKHYIADAGIFSDYFIGKYKEVSMDRALFFQYVVKQRIWVYFCFWISCFTFFGIAVVYGGSFFYGFSAGLTISVATMRFGLTGIGVFLAGIFPHCLIYVPVTILLFFKGSRLCQNFYFQKQDFGEGKAKRQAAVEYILFFLLFGGIMLIGCFLEAYVGTGLLKKMILKL